jgi:hypothetical protein
MQQTNAWLAGRAGYTFLFSALVLMTSCSRKMTFQTSSITPAAQGSVKVKKDNNNNYSIHVQVSHLAPPDKLTPPKQVYVVWMVPENSRTRNIGQLVTSKGFLSGKYKASLKTVTTFKPDRFLISAEDNPAVSFPGTPVILTTP